MKKQNKILLGIGTGVAALAPLAGVIACGSSDTDVKSKITSDQVKKDTAAMALKTKFKGFSTAKIRIIGHKQEVQKQTAAAIAQFNAAFGTNIVIEQVGGTTNYGQYLSAKFANGVGDVGLVQFEQAGAIKSIGDSKVTDITTSDIGITNAQTGDYTSEGKKIIAATDESLGVIYNKDVFKKAGITVHEGEPDAAGATDGLKLATGKITDVYTDDLTLASYKKMVEQVNAVKDVDGFYSTSKTDAGNIWPYTNHLLSAAIKAAGTQGATTETTVLTAAVEKNIQDALEIYNLGSNIKTNTVDGAMGKLASGVVGMSQNGTWALTQIHKTNPNANVGFLPMPVVGVATGHEHAQFMKGTTQKWALIKSGEAKEKTMKMFLEWMYTTQTGINSLYGDFQSETPYALPKGVQAPSDNVLLASAAHYDGNDVTKGGLALASLPKSFNNDSQVLRDAFAADFKTGELAKVQAAYKQLKAKH